MSELDEFYANWEKYSNGEIEIGPLSQILSSSSTIAEDELPIDYHSDQVKELEKYLENTESEASIQLSLRSIQILTKFKNQKNVKILFYNDCLKELGLEI